MLLQNVYPVSPSALARTHNRQVGNQISLRAAHRGEPESYVFGRTVARGKLIAADDSGDKTVIDLHWSVGECQEFEHRIFNGVAEGLGTALGKNEHFLGTSGQSASTIMTGLKGSYDAQANKAHSVLTLLNSSSLEVRMLMKGLKLFDPRLSPEDTVYTTNPALALSRILVDSGYTMDWTSVVDAADYCDEFLYSPQVKRWEIGGQIYLEQHQALSDWIQTMAAYANCFIDLQGTTVALVPDTPRSANHTVSADQMLAASVSLVTPGDTDVAESVTTQFEFIDEPVPPIVQDNDRVGIKPLEYAYGTPAGPGTHTPLSMPFFNSFHAAGRKAEQEYSKSRMRRLTFDTFDRGLLRTAGDVGTITNAAVGLSGVDFTLVNTPVLIAPGRWRCDYVEYSTDNYSDTFYTGTYNDTELSIGSAPPAGPTPSVVEETYTPYAAGWNPSYQTYQRLVITWTGSTYAQVRDYYVVIKEDGAVVHDQFVDHIEPSGSPETPSEHTLNTAFQLVPGALYTVEVYIRSLSYDIGATPGEASIVARVLFYSSDQDDQGGAHNSWVNTDNALLDDGSDDTYAYVEWGNDEESETDWITFYYSLADNGVPDGGTITNITVTVRARKKAGTEVVNIARMQLVAGGSSPEVLGSEQADQELTQDYELYTFSGNLSYWGLTNSQAMELFDDSGNGRLRFVGECEDTSAISGTLFMRVDWVTVGVTFTE